MDCESADDWFWSFVWMHVSVCSMVWFCFGLLLVVFLLLFFCLNLELLLVTVVQMLVFLMVYHARL